MFSSVLYFSRWGAALTLAVSMAAIVFTLPNLVSLATYQSLPSWMQLPRMPLGLDLRGGTHLLYQIDIEQLRKDWLQSVQQEARRAMSEEKIAIRGVLIVGNQVQVTTREPDKAAAAFARLRRLANPITASLLGTGDGGLDLNVTQGEGGIITLSPSTAGFKSRVDSAVSRSIEVIRRRVDPTGTTEAVIQQQGGDRILIQVPGLEPDEVKQRVGTTAKLTFNLVPPCRTDDQGNVVDQPNDILTLPYQDANSAREEGSSSGTLNVCREAIVSGDDLVDASVGFDTRGGGLGERSVDFLFNSRGGAAFFRVTKENIGRRFAIILDNKVISAPVIRSEIPGGRGQITGNFDEKSVNRLALLLRSGALPTALTIQEERSVGPSLGADSIEAGKIAFIIGFVAVFTFMVAGYGLFGFFAMVALMVNLAFIFAALSLFQATLTLPGIAGMVLTMGMSVDANVLINERIRDEIRAQRPPIKAIENGFSSAYGTIFDTNMTALLVAIILYFLGSGPVKGFAVTFAVGIIASAFTAVTITRLLVVQWIKASKPTTVPI